MKTVNTQANKRMSRCRRRTYPIKFSAQMYAATLLAVGLLAVTQAPGRVVWKTGGLSKSARVFTKLGGQELYRAAITINGGAGDLRVFRFDTPMPRLAAQLANRLEAPDLEAEGSLRMATATVDNDKLRLVLLHPAPADPVVCFAIAQTADNFEQSQQPPAQAQGPIALPPGARVEFTGSDSNSGFSATIATTGSGREAVHGYYANAMTSAGWVAPAAATPDSAPLPSTVQIYARRGAVCCIGAMPAAGGRTRITLLHKALGVE